LEHPDLKPETDFRDLVRKPEKLFGYSFLYFLGILIVLGMLYVWNLTGIGKNSGMPLVRSDSSAFVADIPMKAPAVLPPVDIMKAGYASDSLVARGRELFRTACSSCHGDDGRGDGAAGLSLNPKPRNFHALAGWTNGPKVTQIYKTLEEGVPGTGMSSFNYLAPVDRLALAHYVRTFAAGAPVDSVQELQALEATYHLSQGKSTPGQIPIRRATALVLREHGSSAERVAAMVKQVRPDAADPAVQLLARVSNNVTKVLVTFGERRPAFVGESEFVRYVSQDPLAAGFRPSVLQLRAAEWAQLYSCLSALTRTGTGGVTS
jgi:mono/diheme cytochrome c family protein